MNIHPQINQLKLIFSKIETERRAGEISQWLRALVTVPEDPGYIPHQLHQLHQFTTVTPVAGDLMPLLASVGTRHTGGTQIYMQAKQSNT